MTDQKASRITDACEQINNKRGCTTPRRVILQERDVEVLVAVYRFGCMLRSQIEDRYFGSLQRTNSRLLKLVRAKYLVRIPIPLPSQISTAASLQAAYMLGPGGSVVVAGAGGIDPAVIRRQLRHGTQSYLTHTVQIVDFCSQLEREVREHSSISVEGVYPERIARHEYEVREKQLGQSGSGNWRLEIFKPDLVFVLSSLDLDSLGFAVEVDLGHTSATAILKTLDIHSRYREAGLFLKRYKAAYSRTLVITTSDIRCNNLTEIFRKEGATLFWFSTFADAADHGVLGPIWREPGSSERKQLTACD